MTTPGEYGVPAGALSYGELARMADAEARAKQAIRDGIRPAAEGVGQTLIDGLLGGVADLMRGIVRPGFEDAAQAYADGQLALADRLDLLDGLRGYCAVWQDRNVNLAWGINNTRILPFRAPHGPYKGARPETTTGGIVIEEAGAWLVGAKISARSTVFTGSNEVRLRILTYAPNGSLFSTATARANPGTQSGTVSDVTTLIIPEPGYIVRVEMWSGRWRWMDGGTDLARLWAVKQDNRTDNIGTPTVPDETRP